MYLLPVLPFLPELGLVKGSLAPVCPVSHTAHPVSHTTFHICPKEMGYFNSAELLTLQWQ